MDAVAPMLCAGITVYSPMKDTKMLESPGKKLGIIGLGGLGHVAVKFAKAFGLHVTIISTSPSKEKEAKERLGADQFIVSTNPKQMQVLLLSDSLSLSPTKLTIKIEFIGDVFVKFGNGDRQGRGAWTSYWTQCLRTTPWGTTWNC